MLGRTTKKNPVGAFVALSDSTFWKYVGVLGVFASFTILSFYSVVGGWSIAYTYEALIGTFNTTAFDNPSAAGKFFDLKNSSAAWVLGYHTLFLSLVVIILLYNNARFRPKCDAIWLAMTPGAQELPSHS